MDILAILSQALSEDKAREVIKHRRQIGHTIKTERVARKLAKEFGKCPNPDAAADHMMDMGWRGFDARWLRYSAPEPVQTTHHYPKLVAKPVPEPSPEEHERIASGLAKLRYDLSQALQPENAAYVKRQKELREKSERVRANLRHVMAGAQFGGG